ncbi:MAG: TAXI family TRAP transporter solute-binding subunit [Pseudomonadota bacterium]
MKLLLLYRRRWWLFYLPVLLCTAAALWWSSTRWLVLPPAKAVIAAGSPQGSYSRLAQRYAEQLERIGVNVEIVYSDAQKGSLEQLMDARNAASIGFAHGIYANARTPVQALAVVGQEPVWVFSGGPASLAQAKGARVAAGASSSSSFMAAKIMLEHAGVHPADVRFDPAVGVAAAEALIDGRIDMVILAAGEDSQAVQLLMRQGSIQLLGTEHAGALVAQEPHLQALLLPQGAIELRGDIPPRDLTLMSLQTHLLVRPEVHPALQRALLDAAVAIHEVPSFLQRHGQFPSFRGSDFPLSPTARAYSLGARPWMETLLPYGTAQQVELLLYAVIPILAIALVLLAWIPRLFDWRISAALNHFYGDVKFLETEMDSVVTEQPMALRRLLERLDNIERQVVALDLPDEFSERWYTLREHLAAAQDRLLKLRSR